MKCKSCNNDNFFTHEEEGFAVCECGGYTEIKKEVKNG